MSSQVDALKFIWGKTLVVEVRNVPAEMIEQLKTYILLHDMTDPGTLLNLGTWGKARNIDVYISVKGLGYDSWMTRLLVFMYQHFDEVRKAFPPKKRS